MMETIVAEITPPGRGGVSIVRVSGSKTKKIFQARIKKDLKPRMATCVSFYDQQDEIIDIGISIFFPGPHSFTGEDVFEFHGHGGRVVVQRVIESLLFSGARLAKPGEFSERAFLNDKIDLTQAEAIADLIDSHSKKAASLALASLQGVFSKNITQFSTRLITLRMFVESSIDFPEEEIELIEKEKILEKIKALSQEITGILKTANQGALIREGITIVILGKPNVGKSSLLNQLTQKEAAIVTEIPGTTRDLMREFLSIDGIPINIIDTAGIRESEDVIEMEGIRRAIDVAKKADHLLWVTDVREDKSEISMQWNKEIPYTIVKNKIDLLSTEPNIKKDGEKTEIFLSAKTGNGIELLREHLKESVGYKSEETIFIARTRHIEALKKVLKILQSATSNFLSLQATELLAEDLRLAQCQLDEIVGKFTSEDLLSEIFSSFCIGK